MTGAKTKILNESNKNLHFSKDWIKLREEVIKNILNYCFPVSVFIFTDCI